MSKTIRMNGIEYAASSFCHDTSPQCVYLGELPNGDVSLMNSKTGETTRFSRSEMSAFVAGAKEGEFDKFC